MTMPMNPSETDANLGLSEAAIKLGRLIPGYLVSRAIHVAAELDLADHLRDDDKSCGELAALCGAHASTLSRLMGLLVSLGVFAENNGRFSNNAVSALLRSDVPQSMRGWARMIGADFQWSSTQALMHSVQTGESAFQHVYGEDLFSYLSHNAGAAQLFDEAMVNGSNLMNRAILDAYDFSGFTTLVDIAGGYGSTLCAVLSSHPNLRGTLFDLPHVIAKAQAFVASKGLTARCALVSGNFMETVPDGADAYFMKHIIHDWDDERCLKLLRRCHAAMPAHAKLLICEKVLSQDNAPAYVHIADLLMLINTPGGRERTEPEFRALLEKTGFHLIRAIPTKLENWILEVEKA